jgi:hypothetical protein
MNKLLLLLLFVAFTPAIFASGQEPDVVFYKGVQHYLFSNPLESYYEAQKIKRPDFMIEPFTTRTGNWRGYVATWEITDGKLYLTKVNSWLCPGETDKPCHQTTLRELFPGKVSKAKVLADWFTGELRVPDGKLLQYVHMGYGSTYQRDMIFKVDNGIVSEPETIDNTKITLPSETQAALKELQKLKKSPLGNKPLLGPARAQPKPTRNPKSGIVIVPGQGVFSVRTKRYDLESVIGDGEAGSKYDDVYFVEYPKAGVQVSYENSTNTVHVIFLYNQQSRYENFVMPKVRTDRGIDWNSTPEDILKAYGSPVHDYQDESPAKSWRRLEFAGIDFLFQGGRLGRIGILGPDGN